MGIELAQFVVLVVTGLIGWWVKRDQKSAAVSAAEGNDRLAGKLDAVIASQQADQRARMFLEYRMMRVERHLGLSPYSPPDGTPRTNDS